MAKISVCDNGTFNEYIFYCPGCKCCHAFSVNKDGSESNSPPRWKFNGNLESPTFTPSYLCEGSVRDQEGGGKCHLYLTDGIIIYLGDCTHDLRGMVAHLTDLDK